MGWRAIVIEVICKCSSKRRIHPTVPSVRLRHEPSWWVNLIVSDNAANILTAELCNHFLMFSLKNSFNSKIQNRKSRLPRWAFALTLKIISTNVSKIFKGGFLFNIKILGCVYVCVCVLYILMKITMVQVSALFLQSNFDKEFNIKELILSYYFLEWNVLFLKFFTLDNAMTKTR